jgi:predicted dehydrogenase
MTNQRHILVIGGGSAGKRHARNLTQLGAQIAIMDPRQDRRETGNEAIARTASYATLEEALVDPMQYAGVVVASPTTFHIEQTVAALDAGLPVLLEKPLCKNIDEVQPLLSRVQNGAPPVLLGYTYRWWQPLYDLKQRLVAGEIGRVLHVRAMMSAHLADWHPWEPYQEFFMSSAELGGGALLDESHMIDLMVYFFGVPDAVFGKVETLSSLDIDTDDNVDLWLIYPDGLRVWIHLDLYGRPHRREMAFVGEKGTLEWTFDPNRVRFGNDGGGTWQDTTYTLERNDMFMGVAQEFLDILDGKRSPSCTVEDGYQVMKLIEAAARVASRIRL